MSVVVKPYELTRRDKDSYDYKTIVTITCYFLI